MHEWQSMAACSGPAGGPAPRGAPSTALRADHHETVNETDKRVTQWVLRWCRCRWDGPCHVQRAPVTSLASPRMVAKLLARSVTPTAPRASRMLKVWDSLRMWSYAGMGRRFASRRRACGGTGVGHLLEALEGRFSGLLCVQETKARGGDPPSPTTLPARAHPRPPLLRTPLLRTPC